MYNAELEQALLASKITFEEAKKADPEPSGGDAKSKKTAKKAANTLSLDQFNNLKPSQIDDFQSINPNVNGNSPHEKVSL